MFANLMGLAMIFKLGGMPYDMGERSMSLFAEQVVPTHSAGSRPRCHFRPHGRWAFELDPKSCFLFAIGIAPGRLASYRINGETGALTPLTGQCPGFWQLIRLRGDDMEIGAAIFFTDYSMAPTDLAVALEQRGFESLWGEENSQLAVARRL